MRFNDVLWNATQMELIEISRCALTLMDVLECPRLEDVSCSDCENKKMCRGLVELYLTAKAVYLDNSDI